jgi:MBG domain (YGX type)
MNAAFPAKLKSKLIFGCAVSLLVLTSAAYAASGSPAIRILRGASQQTSYGSAFPAPLVVWVTDPATERPVAGLQVNFTPGAGILLSSSSAITDEQGLASVTASGLAACTSSVSAEVVGFPDLKVSFEGLAVDKATLTVLPADLASEVATSVPAATNYTITGFVNGDTPETAQITGLPILTTTANDRSPHANYAIKGGVGSLSSPNYRFVAGFGTLAILNGAKFNNGQAAEPLSDAPMKEDEVIVRSALLSETASPTVARPEFVAGLHGQSGVFVVKAIWTDPASNPENYMHIDARSAMQSGVTNSPNALDAPVRAVDMPKLATFSAASQSSDTRSALPGMDVTMRKGRETPVRSDLLVGNTISANALSTANGQAIRRAFDSPGTN